MTTTCPDCQALPTPWQHMRVPCPPCQARLILSEWAYLQAQDLQAEQAAYLAAGRVDARVLADLGRRADSLARLISS